MHRALLLLMTLQLWGWLRFLGRSLRSVKGIILVLMGGSVFLLWLLMLTMKPPAEGRVDAENVLRYGPIALLAITLLSGLLAVTVQRAISFSPAEVNFLFPGPFSRRQLLAYKILISLAIGLLVSPLVALTMRHHAARALSAWVGLVLMLMFLQFFATALALLASVAGASAFNRSRKVILISLLAALVAAGFWAGKEALVLGPTQALEQIEQSPILSVMLTPFRWFVEAFLAQELWPDLIVKAARGLAVNLGLLVLIFALDAHYLEAAAANSERHYAQIERMRTGGLLAVALSSSGTVRFSLPSLPWWGGIGPTLWRQLLTARRGPMPLVILLVFYCLALAPILASADPTRHDRGGDWILAGTMCGMTIFLTTMMAYDFRPDIDRMDFLKMLPIAPSRLVVGQLAAPVLLVSTLQILVLGVAEVVIGRFDGLFLLQVALFAYPLNFLAFGIENLLFLWYPTRQMPATPGDFQLMGRHIVLLIAKVVVVQLALIPALVLAMMGFLAAALLRLDDSAIWLVTMAGGWLGLAGTALLLVPLLTLSFQRFDVSCDTPP